MTVSSSPLTVVSPDCAGGFFAGRAVRCVNMQRAASLAELRDVLERCLGEPAAPRTLDLVGHSTRGHRLLRLGRTPVDMLNPHVASFFGALAQDGLLPWLQVTAVRLLGCETAVTDAGKRTIRMLAYTLGLPVLGTSKVLL